MPPPPSNHPINAVVCVSPLLGRQHFFIPPFIKSRQRRRAAEANTDEVNSISVMEEEASCVLWYSIINGGFLGGVGGADDVRTS
jgi:hypothetical protein